MYGCARRTWRVKAASVIDITASDGMRTAILADIHGNLPALEAVVADLRQMRPDAVFLAGDQVNRCPWSNEVMDLLAAEGWPMIAGNHELVLAKMGQAGAAPHLSDRRRFPDLWWTLEHLRPEHLETIQRLPVETHLAIDGVAPILMVHGSPFKVTVGFTSDLADAQIQRLLDGATEPVVVGAHTHRPLDRQVGPQRVLNPGSVGMPYNGDPRAQYLLLDADASGLHASFRQVDYPVEAVRREFERRDMMREFGPMAELLLRTVETGLPWISDFIYWMRGQPATAMDDLDLTVATYMDGHGPGRWAFAPESMYKG